MPRPGNLDEIPLERHASAGAQGATQRPSLLRHPLDPTHPQRYEVPGISIGDPTVRPTSQLNAKLKPLEAELARLEAEERRGRKPSHTIDCLRAVACNTDRTE